MPSVWRRRPCVILLLLPQHGPGGPPVPARGKDGARSLSSWAHGPAETCLRFPDRYDAARGYVTPASRVCQQIVRGRCRPSVARAVAPQPAGSLACHVPCRPMPHGRIRRARTVGKADMTPGCSNDRPKTRRSYLLGHSAVVVRRSLGTPIASKSSGTFPSKERIIRRAGEGSR